MRWLDRLFRAADVQEAARIVAKHGAKVRRDRERAIVCAVAQRMNREMGRPEDPRLAA